MAIDLEAFGAHVKARRKRRGHSQGGVPNGPSSTTLSKIERGVMDPITDDAIKKLATGLGWAASDIQWVLSGVRDLATLPLDDDPYTVTFNSGSVSGHLQFEDAASMSMEELFTQWRSLAVPLSQYESEYAIRRQGDISQARQELWQEFARRQSGIAGQPVWTEGDESNGTTPATQKNELDERRERSAPELSEEDDRLAPAADDVAPDDDEEPGGSR